MSVEVTCCALIGGLMSKLSVNIDNDEYEVDFDYFQSDPHVGYREELIINEILDEYGIEYPELEDQIRDIMWNMKRNKEYFWRKK